MYTRGELSILVSLLNILRLSVVVMVEEGIEDLHIVLLVSTDNLLMLARRPESREDANMISPGKRVNTSKIW